MVAVGIFDPEVWREATTFLSYCTVVWKFENSLPLGGRRENFFFVVCAFS